MNIKHFSLKKLLVLFLGLMGTTAIYAQTGVHNGSPNTFMLLHNMPNWVQAYYTTSSGTTEANNAGVQGLTTTTDGSGYHSHAYVVRTASGNSGEDCSACYEQVPGSGNYNRHLQTLASAWDGSGGYVDTVIQIGDRFTSSGQFGNKCQKLVYQFKPDSIHPVLLVAYTTVLQNVVNSIHHFSSNPKVEITVTDASGNLLNLGYYPNDYYTNYNFNTSTNTFTADVNGNFGPHGKWDVNYNDNPNYQPNTAWPYSKYVFAAPGSGGSGYTTMTPSFVDPDFAPMKCPNAQLTSSCCNTGYEVVAYPYTIVAFDLSNYVGQTVKFQIHKHGCTPSAHWAEMYFTAKMVAGKIKGDVCNTDDILFEVPWGFKTYEWFCGIDENSGRVPIDNSGMRTLTLNRNTDQIWPYYCCIMQSWTGVPFVYKAYLKIYDLHPAMGWEQYAGDCAYNFHFCDSSLISQLTPEVTSAGPTGQYDREYMGTWQRTWLYKDENGVTHLLDGGHANDREFNVTFNNVDGNTVMPVGLAITDDNNTCFDTLWTNVIFDDAYVMAPTSEDTIITCEETITYDAATFGDLYTWNSPGRRPVVYPGAAWNGCDSTVYVYFEIQKPRINEVLSSDDYCDAFHTTLSVDASVDVMAYHWSYKYNTDTTFEEGVNPTAPTITITRPGTYSVTITDESGCVASDEITIDACVPFINLPNAITPSNYDGLNDCVEVIQRDLLESLEFMVYNRFGELVYYTEDKNFCWDGRAKGELKTNVTYNWVLKTVDYNGTYKMYKGSIVVL